MRPMAGRATFGSRPGFLIGKRMTLPSTGCGRGVEGRFGSEPDTELVMNKRSLGRMRPPAYS